MSAFCCDRRQEATGLVAKWVGNGVPVMVAKFQQGTRECSQNS